MITSNSNYSSPSMRSTVRIANNYMSGQKERTQLQTIPESLYNNTLPKPLLKRNMKLSSQQCQIKKNISLPKDQLPIQNKENMLQQTFSVKKEMSLHQDCQFNHNHTMGIAPLLLNGISQCSTKCVLDEDQGQQKGQIEKMDKQQKQQQTINNHNWVEQKQSLLSTIGNLTQKLQSIQKQNFTLKSFIEHKNSSKTSSSKQSSNHFFSQQQHSLFLSNEMVSRILSKVQKLQSELSYFINLSCQLKQRSVSDEKNVKELNARVIMCEQQLKVSRQKISIYQALLHQSKQSSLQQLTILQSQHQQTLNSLTIQLCNYQHQYDNLKKHNFLLEQQYRNATDNNSHKQQSFQKQYNEVMEKYQQLMEKYQQLYESYRRLYYEDDCLRRERQQLISQQSSSGFINEVNQSMIQEENGERNIAHIKHNRRPSQHILYYLQNNSANCPLQQMKASCQKLFHCNKQLLSDCSDITNPIESPQQCATDLDSTRPTRIILRELIKETLEINDE